MERVTRFVDVLLPLPLPKLFTYRVPHEFERNLSFGIRVIVPFGKSKLYSGLVVEVHTRPPVAGNAKYIIDTIDNDPVITDLQFRFWKWLAEYYMCQLGEVMAASLPSALKLTSETHITIHPTFEGDVTGLNDKEIKVVEALFYHHLMTIAQVEQLLGIQKVINIIKSLVEKSVIATDEEIQNPYKPKKENYVRLSKDFQSESAFYALLDTLEKSKKYAGQVNILLSLLMLIQEKHQKIDFAKEMLKEDLLKKATVTQAQIKTLVNKGVLEIIEKKISRLEEYPSDALITDLQLSQIQEKAFENIEKQFETQDTVLLHGITGSGKTEIYIKLIDKILAEGKQVLYLLPEIALTTQIVNRLRHYFGEKVGIFHSRFNEYERVEIWDHVLKSGKEHPENSKYQLILGARSALLLPYQNLGLIIIDEEHDASYKQVDPAPRYQARDSALYLASLHHAKTLLGTATPSLESYYNVKSGKFGLVELNQRYAGSVLPDIWIVNLVESIRKKKMTGNFSQFLIDNIGEALAKKEQIILFINRRGFALRLFCNSCQSMPYCKYCDVSLTYHKKSNLLKCHYCGYAIEVPHQCPECGSDDIEMKGFGTERVEESITELFPEARVARMDLDTTRSKNGYQKLIYDFENHNTDILIGTQMVTKGLNFANVTVVGIINADSLISYPDFRSFERAFQIMAQVSGRAGRSDKPGKVIIQSYNPDHPALQYVSTNDYLSMYQNQIEERKKFFFPPFCRLIKLTLKHKDETLVNAAGNELALL
ncbi:MAG: primosomal protein N', partial [Bacteroidales bacterium]|nr:primosomal protein N' [Bacteroidales bacterium]